MSQSSQEQFADRDTAADGEPVQIREYAQQIYREVYRDSFWPEGSELRAWALGKALDIHRIGVQDKWDVLDRAFVDADRIVAYLETGEWEPVETAINALKGGSDE